MHAIYELPSPRRVRRRPPARPRCADGNGTLTPLFFSDDVIDIARAKAICAKCPLAVSCLSGAQERAEPWGVWGGELLLSGRIVRNKRPCGRRQAPPSRARRRRAGRGRQRR
ncbi:MAG: WhiB family transcriptional regulator [Ilumatobacteraceae bacterium]